VKSDPVLGIATASGGDRIWAVGGYAGTLSSSGLGSDAVLPARPAGWRTASIWRFDADGPRPAPVLSQSRVTLPAKPATVSFAFFSGAACRVECAATLDAQPDVNLRAAGAQIASFAKEPGGPSFALLGGDARGPTDASARSAGNGETDFARLPGILDAFGTVPVYAAYGLLDPVPGLDDPSEPWADAFATAPAPFGGAPPAPGTTPVASGGPSGPVDRYYAFDASADGGTLRVVVLDNHAGSLEASAKGQTAWLRGVLADAQRRSLPVIVSAGVPLRGGFTSDGDDVATLLASSGVLAVFTASPTQLNEKHAIPEQAAGGAPQIPEYEGASLGYQQTANNGVVWYAVSVDTRSRTVAVDAIPVIDSISIKPLRGTTVPRSFTLQFAAIARRPVSSLATTSSSSFPGFDNYVSIPSSGCGGRPCIEPTYRFASSDPTIGDFVAPSGSGSQIPALDAAGKTTPSSTSGLFCAFNSGTTTVSVTAGLLSYSLPVTVQGGGFGPPCGTVFRQGVSTVITIHQTRSGNSPTTAVVPPPPPAAVAATVSTPSVLLPPPPVPAPPAVPVPAPVPAPASQPAPAPAPVAPAPVVPAPAPAPVAVAPAPPAPAPVVPVVPPPVPPAAAQPIPPSGTATSQSPAAARRREKVHKHASQSAFSVRPSGSAPGWFFPAIMATSAFALALLGAGIRRKPETTPAPSYARLTSRRP